MFRPVRRALNRVWPAVLALSIRLLSRLSLRGADRLGRAMGRAAFLLLPHLRRQTILHLQQALPDRLSAMGSLRVARESFEMLAGALLEWFVLTRRGPAEAARCVRRVEGWEHVKAALAGGRGLVIVAPHFGLFELMPVAFLQWGVPGRVVGRKPDDEGFESLLTDRRLRMGVETLFQKQAREMLRTLTRNECLGILPDQDIDKLPGIFVPFFGREAYTPTGPASLSVTTGAPILPAFLHRLGPGHHRLEVLPPVPDPGGDREERIRALTLGWSREFERAIAADPRQWAWVHRRWQTTPETLARRRARRAHREADRSAETS